MRLSFRTTLLASALLAATVAQAKTFKYELTDLHSNNGFINYPGLDFNNATSAILTVTQDSPEAQAKISSLEIKFPQASKLVARDFQNVDGNMYRALVNDAWIYRQVVVNLNSPDLNPYNHAPVNIEVNVSEKAGFINPEGEAQGQPVLMSFGMLNDITPAKTVDTASVIMNGKRLNLALSSNLSGPSANSMGGPGGFVIDATWMGKGQQKLYINSGFPQEFFGFVTPIALILDELDGPEGKEYMLSVQAKDHNGVEIPSPMMPLKDLLEQAYGPQI